jgi:hypothetical protein
VGKSLEDLVAEMRTNPADVRFGDASKLASRFFGAPRSKGSSHYIWKMPWAGDPRINLQDARGKTKPCQVRQVLAAIDRLLEEKKT